MSKPPESTVHAAAPELGVMAIARQPILDVKRSIFGYELFDRSQNSLPYSAASDAALLFNLLSNADSEVLNGRVVIFINCTHQTLTGGHLTLIQPEHVVLEVPPMLDHQADPEDIDTYRQTLADVQKRGFRLAFTETVLAPAYANWLSFASFIKLDLTRVNPQQLAAIVAHAKKVTSAQLVAEKVETAEQFELTKSLGFNLFQGYWFAKPVLIHGQAIRPTQAAVIQLINLVRKQASTAEIEDIFKRDATLSYNLLRFINSAGFGLSCEVTSFRHAVMLLGLKKLFRWAALLMTTSQASGGSPAVGHAAIVRGRLMELLAAELLPQEECDNAFVVGIFSLLDTMVGLPLKQVLDSISLPQTVTDALLNGTGLLAPFLKLTLACENVDDVAFAEHTNALQLTDHQVNWAHLQALAWSESLTTAE
ncbi:MAG: HDOD domain-containing protein [Rhodoferax sp.]|uniref:EAL and HDOD domain-containing protein n=1 Tax=Rhodoferax sp. TaxID=50421 RepID=UPI00261930F6|nr:HDOD domain-containing protein [Rhodoferax sp.]MDD2881398.1 HDOD domain-containing protein [Rhodoferax sp.]